MTNRRWLLAQRPSGNVAREHFRLETQPDAGAAPSADHIRLRYELLLCAPTIRNWISGNRDSYYPTVEIGDIVMAPAIGWIVESANPLWPVGSRVTGFGTWQDEQWVDPSRSGLRIIPEHVSSVDAFGIAGMNALIAFYGLRHVARLEAGEVVLVSGAAGSVGSMAAQIARLKGCRVIALCGGAEKVAWLRGACAITDVIDYRSEDVDARLNELCPHSIDVFFDNVGGALLQQIVGRMKRHGRVALCGQIATYDSGRDNPSLDMMRIIYGAIRLEGFLVTDFAEHHDVASEELLDWRAKGLIAHREDVRSGFDNIPETFFALFDGSNMGTLISRIADEDGQPV